MLKYLNRALCPNFEPLSLNSYVYDEDFFYNQSDIDKLYYSICQQRECQNWSSSQGFKQSRIHTISAQIEL